MALSLDDAKYLIEQARQAIELYLKEKRVEQKDWPEKLMNKQGVFVTLHTSDGELRGCIGYPQPIKPLAQAVVESAVHAAFNDPRFPSLTQKEFSDIKIELSILSVPELIEVSDVKEYPKHVEIGKHGLIIEYGAYSGLLLPQVPVEQDPVWDSEKFLEQTCWKAGLSPDMWLHKGVKIYRFTGQIFAEKTPGGEVVEKKT